jgi:hypothetical protein
MRIWCPFCGKKGRNVVQVSPDYRESTHLEFIASAGTVRYIFDSRSVDLYVLSPEFMSEHCVEPGSFPLPDDYPDWIRLIKFVCRDCFEARGTKPEFGVEDSPER